MKQDSDCVAVEGLVAVVERAEHRAKPTVALMARRAFSFRSSRANAACAGCSSPAAFGDELFLWLISSVEAREIMEAEITATV